jgi:hypothetical protein
MIDTSGIDKDSSRQTSRAIDIWGKVVEQEYEQYIKPRRKELYRRLKLEAEGKDGGRNLSNKARDNIRTDLDTWLLDDTEGPRNTFGIALSGGGIRSATVSLGFLEILNAYGILEKADFLSTVSGGGYLGSFVHGKLWHKRNKSNPFRHLFEPDDIKRFRDHRQYLTPGKGKVYGAASSIQLFSAYLVSFIMNLIWIVSLAVTLYFLGHLIAHFVAEIPPNFSIKNALVILVIFLAVILVVHFFFHKFRHTFLSFWNSNWIDKGEAALLLGIILVLLIQFFIDLPQIAVNPYTGLFISFVVFLLTGFFADPNVLTMHRFYRDRVARAFCGKDLEKIRLSALSCENEKDCNQAPYPLINTCLNVRDRSDEEARGTIVSDYFLFSPLNMGSVLTRFAKTPGHIPLSTVIAASGAAVSPEMGARTSRIGAFFMTLFNIRLGYWARNPRKLNNEHKAKSESTAFKQWMDGLYQKIPWWPLYHLRELFVRSGIQSYRVNVSDGGHIENLGVFELLRRGCKLIIALDASADPKFEFGDLENLIRAAREQIGVELDFGDLSPEEHIRPKPSVGYSKSHYVIAKVRTLPGADIGKLYGEEERLLIYAKSSLRAVKEFTRVDSNDEGRRAHDYKRHNPLFPHEPTTNQFFDIDQWEAYRYLGRYIAGDLLGENVRDLIDENGNRKSDIDESISITELFKRWESISNAKPSSTTDEEWLDHR